MLRRTEKGLRRENIHAEGRVRTNSEPLGRVVRSRSLFGKRRMHIYQIKRRWTKFGLKFSSQRAPGNGTTSPNVPPPSYNCYFVEYATAVHYYYYSGQKKGTKKNFRVLISTTLTNNPGSMPNVLNSFLKVSREVLRLTLVKKGNREAPCLPAQVIPCLPRPTDRPCKLFR